LTELLTKTEERELIQSFQETGNKRALDELVTRNFKLVHKLTHKFPVKNASVTYDDLFQEGIAGFIHAVKKFDLDRNLRLSTYAYRWIFAYLSRYYQNNGRTIRVPVHLSDKNLTLRKQIEELTTLLGRTPTRDEIVEMNPDADKIATAMVQPLSLNYSLGEDGELQDLAGVDPTQERDLVMDVEMMLVKLKEQVSDRDFAILVQRYGLDHQGERTLQEVSESMGVSRARCHQVERKLVCLLREMVK
jgi:RNA polymerase primary sigma factor